MKMKPNRPATKLALLLHFTLIFLTLCESGATNTTGITVKRQLGDRSVRVPPGMVVVPSTKTLEDTYNDLVASLEANPNLRIVAQIDHASAADGAGLELTPTKLVVFGNPALGTPLMTTSRRVGLDLPQKMLVWEDETNGQVYVGYNKADYLATRYPDIATLEQLDIIQGALANLAAGAAGVEREDVKDRLSAAEIRFLQRNQALRNARSDFDFATTLERLKLAIRNSPASIAFEVDHATNAASVGASLEPSTLVVFGNPVLGTPLMQANPSSGIDLPLKMLVWQDGDTVWVTTNAPYYLRKRHGLARVGDNIAVIRTAVFNFLNAATQEDP